MKKFRFPLRSVATVRNLLELRAREQFSRAVRACTAAERALEDQRARVNELESIIRSGRLGNFRAADQAVFMDAFKEENAQIAKLMSELNTRREELEAARQGWFEARRDVRVIENLEQRARALHRHEVERENQAAMDDRASALAARSLTPVS